MIRLRAYAKINLGLRVIRKRGDGFHDIETIFHRVLPFDEITLEPDAVISLNTNDRSIPTGKDNLCVRAAELLQQRCPVPSGVRITLSKNIPVGAGLGGGSSDAAATLEGLNELWGLNLPANELHALGLNLGSDVPFFLQRQSAFARGRGEDLTPIHIDLPYWTVLAHPDIHISTQWAYQHLNAAKRQESQTSAEINSILRQADTLRTFLANDFEDLVFRVHPEVGALRQRLYDAGARLALMSGTGSAVFGLFSDEVAAGNAARDLERDVRVFITPPHFYPT